MSPSDDNMRGQLPTPGQGQNPGPGGGYPAPQPPQSADNSGAMLVATIVQSARLLARKFPMADSELRQITNLMSAVQQKMTNSRPAPETSAPPV
jgi:hypothetical protein